MQRYKDVKKVIETRELIEMTCDLCGKRACNSGYWPTDSYQQNDTDVELRVKVCHRDVVCYPNDEPNGEEIEFHICPECFKGKLAPWIQSQGAKTKYKDVGLGK